jgi:hypothetical protein
VGCGGGGEQGPRQDQRTLAAILYGVLPEMKVALAVKKTAKEA